MKKSFFKISIAISILVSLKSERSVECLKDEKVVPKTEVNGKTHEIHENETLRIMYGSVVIPHSKPWVVGLANKNNGRIKCGGVLISNKHVLTALHCMTTKLKRYVIVGEHDQNNTNDGQRYIRINEFHLHPNSTTKYGIYSFDLAILVL